MDTPITISGRNRPAPQSHHLSIGALIFPQLELLRDTGQKSASRKSLIDCPRSPFLDSYRLPTIHELGSLPDHKSDSDSRGHDQPSFCRTLSRISSESRGSCTARASTTPPIIAAV